MAFRNGFSQWLFAMEGGGCRYTRAVVVGSTGRCFSLQRKVEAADILLQSVSNSRDNILVTGVVIYLPQRSIGQLPCDGSRITEG